MTQRRLLRTKLNQIVNEQKKEQKEYVVLHDELERLMLLETGRDMTDSASYTLNHAMTMARMSTKDDDNFIIPFDIDVASSTSRLALLDEEEEEEEDDEEDDDDDKGLIP